MNMYCKKCGTEISENSAFCPKCGTSVSAAISTSKTTSNAPKSTAGFVCGLLGFLFSGVLLVGLVLSITGVALCGSSKKFTKKNPGVYAGTGLILAGKILGIMGIVFSSIVTVITVIWGLIMGEGLLVLWDMILGY